MMNLTAKQRKSLNAIEAYIKTKGFPPTVREIGEIVGEATPGAVQGILNRLVQKGAIKRESGMARSIQIVSEDSQYAKPIYIAELKKVTQRNLNDLFNMYNINKYQPFPQEFINIDDKCFIIDCPDNSMYDSGITYDDKLIISTIEEYKAGDIILLSYETHILLRKYCEPYNNSTFNLKADSDLLKKEIFLKSEIAVIGKLIGKITRY